MKITKKENGRILVEMGEHDLNILYSVFSRMSYYANLNGRLIKIYLPFSMVCDRIFLDVKNDIENAYFLINSKK